MATHVLIVDDDDITRESLSTVLTNRGFLCRQAENGAVALREIKQTEYDVVITDLEMPELTGMQLLVQATAIQPRLSFIIITAYASIETAIEALRKGAYDYLLKPLNLEDVAFKVRKLIEHKELVSENQALRQELHAQYHYNNIIGQSAAIKKVFNTINKVSDSESNVLITGKSGSGKELVAKSIHYNSRHRQGRFVAVNCGAITETLFESEMFGHKKGSFTGAVSDKAGLFKAAHRGTLFLDEIGELTQASQAKLLRAIETKTIMPVGSTQPENVHIRIIAATHRDLKKEVEEGRFREDLYYRVNVIQIHLPSLSERQEDIPLLVNHFILKYNRQMNKRVTSVAPELMHYLMRRTWEGEVRELENFIERLMIFSRGEVLTKNELPANLFDSVSIQSIGPETEQLKLATEQFEKVFILSKLDKYNHHRGKTAKALGIGEATLYRKMNQLGIDTDRSS